MADLQPGLDALHLQMRGAPRRRLLCVVDGETYGLDDACTVALARNPLLTWTAEDLEPLPDGELGVSAHG